MTYTRDTGKGIIGAAHLYLQRCTLRATFWSHTDSSKLAMGGGMSSPVTATYSW